MASVTKDLPALPSDPSSEDMQKPPAGVFKRLKSKLRSPSQSWHVPTSQGGINDECSPDDLNPPSSPKKENPKRKASMKLLSLPGSTTLSHRRGGGPELENAFTSAEQRQAALRAVGLVPANAKPGRDAYGYMLPLSEQEAQLDKHFTLTPGEPSRPSRDEESEAQKIKEAWLRKNTDDWVVVEGEEHATGANTRARATSRSPVRTQWETAEPRWMPEFRAEPKPIEQPLPPPPPPPMTTEQVRARRKDDPVFAPSGLLAAMQAYRPENYRPPPGRIPPSPPKPMAQTRRGQQEPETDSD